MAANDFKFIKQEQIQEEAIVTKFKSSKREVAEKFAKNKVAMIGVLIFFLLLIISMVIMSINHYKLDKGDSSQLDLIPTADHWFGTDTVGRDLWKRSWAAVQYSLFLSLIATTLNVLIAVLIGLSMGYFDKFDRAFSGVIKVMYAIPTIIVLILFSIVFRTSKIWLSVIVIIVSLIFSGWVDASQQVRGIVKKTRNLDFITASQTLGTSRIKMLGVLFVYALPIVIVQFAIIFPRMIIAEATLGFLGLSIPDLPTLGNLINDSRNSFLAHPHELFFPLSMLALTTVSIQFIGFGLEDAILGKDGV